MRIEGFEIQRKNTSQNKCQQSEIDNVFIMHLEYIKNAFKSPDNLRLNPDFLLSVNDNQ
jgi:hypothetical protein